MEDAVRDPQQFVLDRFVVVDRVQRPAPLDPPEAALDPVELGDRVPARAEVLLGEAVREVGRLERNRRAGVLGPEQDRSPSVFARRSSGAMLSPYSAFDSRPVMYGAPAR
ncbi:MAG: hypothetical protein M5U26_05420 [Planctomycetota bacterium]|nr:hypothetical protein [Planctomycetota bacterium]